MMMELIWPEQGFISHLRTPLEHPWTERRQPADADPRAPFDRDRDRIIHSTAFQNLQHKTQVYIVHEADFYRTRLTHTLEVSQISRAAAWMMGLQDALVEAIALAHDVGHTPFGHAGERALNSILRGISKELTWDSNHYSLTLLDEGHPTGPARRGLNLTFATRQGVARHQSPFDYPRKDFDTYASPTLECQVVNLADFIAYSVHDAKDALKAGVLTLDELFEEPALRIWHQHIRDAQRELQANDSDLEEAEQVRLLAKRAGSNLIGVSSEEKAVSLSNDLQTAGVDAVAYMIDRVYQSPLVSRQNFKAQLVMERLFEAFSRDHGLMPRSVQRRIRGVERPQRAREIARYIAGLTDRTAIDLHAELFDPRDRAMGHHRT